MDTHPGLSPLPPVGFPAPEWRVSTDPIPYDEAVAWMEARAADIAAGTAPELIWLLEHPSIVTGGTSADSSELVEPDRFPVAASGRGGRFTYHGPGQRVVYVLVNLSERGRDVRCYVHALEQWAIAALASLGVSAATSNAGVGIWVDTPAGEMKIGAIGVRVKRWVTLHGMAINVLTDLSAYQAIIPCGIGDRGVTRISDLVPACGMADLDAALRRNAADFLAAITPHGCKVAPAGLMNPLEGGSNSG